MRKGQEKMTRLRTIKKAYDEIKALDPNTSITRYYIEQIVINGEIPVTMAGRKRLIDLDQLLNHLRGAE